jgi:Protein of unknown function (DUF2817)
VQIAALQDVALRAACRDAGVTLVFSHAVNPYGFSYWRRFTQENVDLNRNFQDSSQPRPVNQPYAEVQHLLLPEVWPPDAANRSALEEFIDTHGMKVLQSAVSGGQYAFADGLFYGGNSTTWSNQAFRRLLRRHLASAAQMGWIDLHTGLGPSGYGERILPAEIGGFERASRWWSGGGRTPLTRAQDGSSTSAVLTGTIGFACLHECAQTEITAIGLEYGTVSPLDVMEALRAEQWLTLHPQTDEPTRRRIKQQFLAAFFVDTPQWQASVLSQGLEAIGQGIAGLASQA